jgi:hypothetical protein
MPDIFVYSKRKSVYILFIELTVPCEANITEERVIKINRYYELTNERIRTNTYIHTYHSRFIPRGVTEVSQIFLRDTHFLSKLVSYEEHCRRDRW